MEFTAIGFFTAIVGLCLIPASNTAMFCFLIFCSLMGGASAIDLPALGGSSIPPVYFSLVFLIIRLAKSSLTKPIGFRWPTQANVFLMLYATYGIISAFLMPRLFYGDFMLPPMKAANSTTYFTVPVAPSAQNVTQAFYLFGTFVAAFCASIVARRERNVNFFIRTIIVVCWCHITFGLLDLIIFYTHAPNFLDFLRNGSYAQLTAEMNGFHRISGIFPEASAYAIYGFILLVFVTELWLRNVWPSVTASTSAALCLILLACTSSSGLIGIGLYFPIVLVRAIIGQPRRQSIDKTLKLLAAGLLLFFIVLALINWNAAFASDLLDTFNGLISKKAESGSGIQRMFWAQQGLEAFKRTYGLGIGPGSFRSSSLVTAMIGSCGLVGTVFFSLYALRVWYPLRSITHRLDVPTQTAVAAAAGWSTVLGLIPAAVAGSSPDPGFQFAVFAGVALAWGHQNISRARLARMQRMRVKHGLEEAAPSLTSFPQPRTKPRVKRARRLASKKRVLRNETLRVGRKGRYYRQKQLQHHAEPETSSNGPQDPPIDED